MEVEYAPSMVGLFPTLTLKLTKLEGCKLNTTIAVGAGTNGCKFELSSSGVTEPTLNYFVNGSLGFKCSPALGFETSYCGITIGSQTPLSEYEWNNIHTTSPFKSELLLKLTGITYISTGTGCGSSASNGKLEAEFTALNGVIMK